jgi:CheY-like chemotaxis protein
MPSILLLEDNDDLRFTYEEALKNCGCEVISVGNCADAIRMLKVHKPDALICDLMIGSETSINVSSYAAYAVPEAEVIFITGSGMFPQGELFAMSHNMRWVLRKPVAPKELQEVLLHVLEKPNPPSSEMQAIAN